MGSRVIVLASLLIISFSGVDVGTLLDRVFGGVKIRCTGKKQLNQFVFISTSSFQYGVKLPYKADCHNNYNKKKSKGETA